LASIEFYVRILVEFLLARFTLFVKTNENHWAVKVRFSEKKVRNAPQYMLVTAKLVRVSKHMQHRLIPLWTALRCIWTLRSHKLQSCLLMLRHAQLQPKIVKKIPV